jgi:hypothetical protein
MSITRTQSGRTGMWFAIAIFAAGCSSIAKADWTQAGAQYLCDGQSQVFELLPYDRSSDDPPGGITPKTGYREIPQNAPPIVCALGTMSLHAAIAVSPPASHGQGMGDGYVAVIWVPTAGLYDVDPMVGPSSSAVAFLTCWHSSSHRGLRRRPFFPSANTLYRWSR